MFVCEYGKPPRSVCGVQLKANRTLYIAPLVPQRLDDALAVVERLAGAATRALAAAVEADVTEAAVTEAAVTEAAVTEAAVAAHGTSARKSMAQVTADRNTLVVLGVVIIVTVVFGMGLFLSVLLGNGLCGFLTVCLVWKVYTNMHCSSLFAHEERLYSKSNRSPS